MSKEQIDIAEKTFAVSEAGINFTTLNQTGLLGDIGVS